MSTQWQIIDEFDRTITVAGREFTARVEITVADDDTDPADGFDFGSETENAAYLARFESGELANVCIRVRAMWNGLEGVDRLGACHVKAGNDAECLSLAADHSMIELALEDLAVKMAGMRAALVAEDAP